MEEEFRKERLAIMRGICRSAQKVIRDKAEKNLSVAVSRDRQVTVVPAKKLLLNSYR